MQAAIAMSQRAKVASERAKDPEKKKDLASAHRVYQQYINANKKVRTNMELIVTLAMKFWMWTILIALIIIGFIVNLFDKKQPKLYTFAFTDYPLMKPIRIATKGKGFFTMIKMWILGVRHWEIAKDFEYVLNGNKYVIKQVLNLMVQVYQNSCIRFYHQLVYY